MNDSRMTARLLKNVAERCEVWRVCREAHAEHERMAKRRKRHMAYRVYNIFFGPLEDIVNAQRKILRLTKRAVKGVLGL